jgi:actin related protein 2/3 complex subunit 1A/1B
MAAPEVHHLFHNPIADHAFTADRKTLAIARDNTVELYAKVGNAFKLKDELKSHDKTVTSVDIAPNSGRIVSCSQGLSFRSSGPAWRRPPLESKASGY